MQMIVRIAIIINLFYSSIAFSQNMDISFPQDRAIYQRNKSNNATIFIGGTYRVAVDRFEARLLSVQGGNSTNWTVIDVNPANGIFKGNISSTGGWYELQIRGIKDDNTVATANIGKVGIGEVFLISGQSNAAGFYGSGQKAAQDDRVNIISNFFSFGQNKPNFPSFARLNSESNIAPTGRGAWYWGELGDMLASRLNVPILFMNAAHDAMTVREFLRSSNGQQGVNPYNSNKLVAGYPFGSMTDAIRYYVNLLGIRGVLFHQGETDNYLLTSQESYFNDMLQVINNLRSQTGKNLSWVMARASKNDGVDYSPVINAQNAIINNVSNTFAGPETDNIGPRLADGTHFSSQAFTSVASAWSSTLNTIFFDNSIPFSGNPPLDITLSCDFQSNNGAPANLRAASGFNSYNWNIGSNADNIQVGSGNFRATSTDRFGNIYYSTFLSLDQSLFPQKPSIIPSGPLEFCNGKKLELSSSTNSINVWSDGQIGKKISVKSEGNYFVTNKNVYGCQVNSDQLLVIRREDAPKPIVTSSSSLEFCDRDSTSLIAENLLNFKWNTGPTTSSLKVKNSGLYFGSNTNQFGCITYSDSLSVKVNPLPSTPTINLIGQSDFCVNEPVQLNASNAFKYQWSSGEEFQNIRVSQSGEYSVRTINEFGCFSDPSNSFRLNAYFIPDNPVITQSSPYGLSAVINFDTDNINYTWLRDNNNLNLNNEVIKANQSGAYTLHYQKTYSLSGNRSLTCTSAASTPFQFSIDPNLAGASFFPNPNFDGDLYIDVLENIKNASVTIFNPAGQIMRKYSVKEFNALQKVSVKGLAQGIYNVMVSGDNLRYLGKIAVMN